MIDICFVAICVLMWNKPVNYYDLLVKELNIQPIDQVLHVKLMRVFISKNKISIARKTEAFHVERAKKGIRKNKQRMAIH